MKVKNKPKRKKIEKKKAKNITDLLKNINLISSIEPVIKNDNHNTNEISNSYKIE